MLDVCSGMRGRCAQAPRHRVADPRPGWRPTTGTDGSRKCNGAASELGTRRKGDDESGRDRKPRAAASAAAGGPGGAVDAQDTSAAGPAMGVRGLRLVGRCKSGKAVKVCYAMYVR